jgi:hypothetical protein
MHSSFSYAHNMPCSPYHFSFSYPNYVKLAAYMYFAHVKVFSTKKLETSVKCDQGECYLL